MWKELFTEKLIPSPDASHHVGAEFYWMVSLWGVLGMAWQKDTNLKVLEMKVDGLERLQFVFA